MWQKRDVINNTPWIRSAIKENLIFFSIKFLFHFSIFQIAYRTAGNKFEGRLAELFLILSDDHAVPVEAEASDSHLPVGRGTKHRLEDDQMSTGSGSKRQDLVSSAEKKGAKSKASKSSQKKNSK